MKLIMSPASPFVRKCRVVIREANLSDVVEEVEVSTTPLNSAAAALAANPTGKIPALVRDEGPAIFDSRVITRYLDNHANSEMYPESRLWEVLTLEAMADAMMDAMVSMTYEVRLRPEENQSAEWIDAQWAKVERAIMAIEDRWMTHLTGPLTVAQIGVACALSYADLRHGPRGWREGHQSLADWHASFQSRESMQDTSPA